MSQTIVASRYVKAFFALTKENNLLSGVKDEMVFIKELFDSSSELSETIAHPVLPITKKSEILLQIFKGKLSEFVTVFINFLVEKRRIEILPTIAELFLEMEKSDRGVVDAKLVSAKEISDKDRGAFEKKLSSKFKKSVILDSEEEADLIGGFKLFMGDKVYDYSISHQLDLLKEDFLTT